MADGWTTVGAVPDGGEFELAGGHRFARRHATARGAVRCRDSGGDSHYLAPGTPCRPLLVTPVAPGLDPALAGLLRHALATGETMALQDWLTEANGERALAEAVRANERRRCMSRVGRWAKYWINQVGCSGYAGAAGALYDHLHNDRDPPG